MQASSSRTTRPHSSFFLAGRSAQLAILLFATALALATLSLAFLLASGPSASGSAPASNAAPDLPRGSRIPWRDGSYFLSGLNYPYYGYYGGDIATLSSVDPSCNWYYESAFNYAAIDADFAEMQRNGVHVVRWFLFGDGRGAPEFDNSRFVTGFDGDFFNHLDQVMRIAQRRNIHIVWSLWDFLMFWPSRWLCTPSGLTDAYATAEKLPPGQREAFISHLKMAEQAPNTGNCFLNGGGHRNLITDTSPGGAQDSFFNNALVPLLQRYANNPNIVGWEIMNEPEWALLENPYTGQGAQVPEPVSVEQMRAFFARFTQAVHTHAPNQYATVGGASLKFYGFGQNLQSGIWTGLGFDYYTAHYYGWMEGQWNNGSPLTIDYNTTAQQFDAPVVIGEFPANGGNPPVYLPSVRRTGGETSALTIRYICTAYAPSNEPNCTRPYTATIEYYNPNGTISTSQPVVIPPYGAWSGQVPPGSGSFSGAARIVANGPVSAAITQTGILSAPEEVLYTGQDKGNTTLWLPRVTNGGTAGTARTRIAVQNTTVSTATVTLRYYNAAGTEVASDNFTLGPRGSVVIDPQLGGSPGGPPAGFLGSAILSGTRPLAAVAYELDPQAGSDAYTAEPEGYTSEVYLPSVRNAGAGGAPLIYVQNPVEAQATVTLSYYNSGGTMVAQQQVTLPAHGSGVVDPSTVLTAGFEGSAIVTSTQRPAVVMRSRATQGANSAVALYAGTQRPDQRLHFPVAHKPNGDGTGSATTFSIQNVSAAQPITVWLTLHDLAGAMVYTNTNIVLPPRGEWAISTADMPTVPAGFTGTAEVLWPWPWQTGWTEGFPLFATALDIDAARSRSVAYRGIASSAMRGGSTPYSASQIMEGVFGKHWAGALGWSYYDLGTGTWDDLRDVLADFDANHAADVRIGASSYTPIPTPANPGTATALAATNTPSYGNPQTATAVASGTPHPPCSSCNVAYTDVQPGSTFYEWVMCLACRNIVSGYGDGTFRPSNPVTRGQLSKIVSNAAGYSDPHTEQTFQDIAPGSTFYDFVQRLSSRGIVSGYPCGGAGEPCVGPENRPYFRPNANVTRGQASKIVASAKGLPAPPAGQRTFEDVAVGSTFWQWIEALASTAAIAGYPCGGAGEPCVPPLDRPYFRPANPVTRGQSAKIVSYAFFPGCTFR